MVTRGWALLLIGLLAGLSGCFAIRLPNKIVINEPDKNNSKPAPLPLPPCDPADLPGCVPSQRQPLAVLDFRFGEDMGADVGRALADLCRDAIQESGQFVLVDRDRIADVLGERDFTAAVQCDNAVCLVKYGKVLDARKMMHGRISQLGEVYVLAVGMTDVETGRQVSKSASLPSIEDSTQAVPNLVCQILRNVPAEGR